MDWPSNFRKSRQESIMWRETEQYFHNPIGIRQSTFRLAHRPYIPCRWSRTIYIHIYDFPWGKNHRSWRNLRAHYSWFTRLSASDTTRYRANHQYNREKDHFPISRVYIEASNVVISLLLSELSRPRSRIAFPFAEPSLTVVLTMVHRFSLAFPRRTFCPARFQRSREFRRRNNSLVEKSTGSPDYACSSFQLVFKRYDLDCQSCMKRRISIRYRQIRARWWWCTDKCNEYSDFHHLSNSARGANASTAVLGASVCVTISQRWEMLLKLIREAGCVLGIQDDTDNEPYHLNIIDSLLYFYIKPLIGWLEIININTKENSFVNN